MKTIYLQAAMFPQRQPVGSLGAHIAEFKELIDKQGYPKPTSNRKIRMVVDLDRWLERHSTQLTDFDEEWATAFLKHRRGHGYCCHGDQTTLRVLLEHLRAAGVIPHRTAGVDQSSLARTVHSFELHLLRERALKQVTSKIYLFEVRRFLSHRFGAGSILLGELSALDISRFMLSRAGTASPRGAQLTATALRSFLQFAFQRGDISTDLAASVPPVANHRFSGIPKFLTPEQIEGLLRTCNRRSRAGQRDFAILLLLARLGLRAGEVVNMMLDDIDWNVGQLLVRGKGSRKDYLPIPPDVGNALATYLRNGRPRCSSRHVFIRLNAPHRGLAKSVCICNVVRRALRCAGLDLPFKGSHLLRHSLATRMLRAGATLAEIGTILRHQHPNTTEIYAKVDLSALRGLAQPWPGGGHE